MENRHKNKKRFNFSQKKDCAIKSLYEINCFLNKLNTAYTIKKILKNK